jgi:hypothetical protein
MTKQEEITLLREMAEKFGPNSYVGPWLKSVIPQVEYCVGSDFAPEEFVPTIPQTREECGRMIETAGIQATHTIEAAKRVAKQTTEAAEKERARCLEYAADALRKALKEIGHYAGQ